MRAPIPLFATLVVLATDVCAFAPVAAAIWARRLSWRPPEGQVAICWLVMALLGLVGVSRFYFGFPPRDFPISGLAFGLFPLLLLYPTLTWIGGRATRWRWPALGAWCLSWAIITLELGGGRMLLTVAFPVMAAGMCALSGWALAARVHGAPEAVRRQSWFWILTAHILYFAVQIFRGPLIETLVARHWDVIFHVYDGILLLYGAVYLIIAYGVSRRPETSPAPQPSPLARSPA